jgi:hypothetical protein
MYHVSHNAGQIIRVAGKVWVVKNSVLFAVSEFCCLIRWPFLDKYYFIQSTYSIVTITK